MSRMRRLNDLRNQVFGNELLREHILSFVVQEGTQRSVENVRTCRLVHSSWLRSVNKCLRRSRQPLFCLRIQAVSFYNPTDFLKLFYEMIARMAPREDQFPPITIFVQRSFFEQEGAQKVKDLLHRVASGLVQVTLRVPIRMRPATGRSKAKFQFPVLTDVEIGIHPNFDGRRDVENDVRNNFVQQVLDGCQNLTRFKLVTVCADRSLSLNVQSLRLPPTVKIVRIVSYITVPDFLGILESNLPKLQKLGMPYTDKERDNDAVTVALQKFSDNLTHLKLDGYSGPVQLPGMKSLASLDICGNLHCGLGREAESGMERKYPSLKHVAFRCCPLDAFCSFAERSRFETVKTLHVSVQARDDADGDKDTLGLRYVTLAHHAFPNIVKLTIIYDVTYGESGLQFIFQNFTNLRELELSIRLGNGAESLTEVDWISLLLGVSRELADSLEKEAGKRVKMRELGNDQGSSIANMTALKRLFLGNHFCIRDDNIRIDPIFHYALLKMENLEIVKLDRTLEISRATLNKWRKTGREFYI